MAYRVTLIPGDGIGPEVTGATCQVLEAAGLDAEWIKLPAGAAAAETHGDVLPPLYVSPADFERDAGDSSVLNVDREWWLD